MDDDRRTAADARIERRWQAASAIVEGHTSMPYETVASMLQSSPETVRRHYARTARPFDRAPSDRQD